MLPCGACRDCGLEVQLPHCGLAMHFSWKPQLLPPRHSSADRGPPLLGRLPVLPGALHLSGG